MWKDNNGLVSTGVLQWSSLLPDIISLYRIIKCVIDRICKSVGWPLQENRIRLRL